MSDIRTLASRLPFWVQVTRLDRPVGWIVLLWPTWIALLIAGRDWGFSIELWVIFTLGVILTRSAGCVVNDMTDREFDRHVKRTRTRPLATGHLSMRDALWLTVTILLGAFGLVLLTNQMTIMLSVVALALALIYPWLKRVTFWPQIGLGMAFSMAIPMAFTAYSAPLDRVVIGLMIGNLAWTLAYDTFYAMVDRDDDRLIGVKSTAIRFGQYDLVAIGIAQTIALVGFGLAFYWAGLSWIALVGWIAAAGMAIYHQRIAKTRSRDACFRAFLENHRFGACLFIGACADTLLHSLIP